MNRIVKEVTQLEAQIGDVFNMLSSNKPDFQLIDFACMVNLGVFEKFNEIVKLYQSFDIHDEKDPYLCEFKEEVNRVCCEIHVDDPLYCSFDKYKQQYESSLKVYLSRYNDSSEIDFIDDEIKGLEIILRGDYQCQIYNQDLYPDVFQRERYARSAKRKMEFLTFRADVVVKKREALLNSFIQDLEEETSVDYSGNRIGERIAIMYFLGILDFLMSIFPFNSAPNKLAECLSSFMGVKQGTIQSYINPIFSKGVNQSKSALTNKNKTKAIEKLVSMGFDVSSCNSK